MEAAGRFQRAGARSPSLVLEGEPVTFSPPTLPGHRMLRLQVRNVGPEQVVLHAADLELLDEAGEALHASSGFGRARDATTGSATVPPGQLLSLDFAWRTWPHTGAPARLQVRDASIGLTAGERLPVHALHDVGERDRLA
jgi:hypothetical protein